MKIHQIMNPDLPVSRSTTSDKILTAPVVKFKSAKSKLPPFKSLLKEFRLTENGLEEIKNEKKRGRPAKPVSPCLICGEEDSPEVRVGRAFCNAHGLIAQKWVKTTETPLTNDKQEFLGIDHPNAIKFFNYYYKHYEVSDSD